MVVLQECIKLLSVIKFCLSSPVVGKSCILFLYEMIHSMPFLSKSTSFFACSFHADSTLCWVTHIFIAKLSVVIALAHA